MAQAAGSAGKSSSTDELFRCGPRCPDSSSEIFASDTVADTVYSRSTAAPGHANFAFLEHLKMLPQNSSIVGPSFFFSTDHIARPPHETRDRRIANDRHTFPPVQAVLPDA